MDEYTACCTHLGISIDEHAEVHRCRGLFALIVIFCEIAAYLAGDELYTALIGDL